LLNWQNGLAWLRQAEKQADITAKKIALIKAKIVAKEKRESPVSPAPAPPATRKSPAPALRVLQDNNGATPSCCAARRS
jgi:hypothetical protein